MCVIITHARALYVHTTQIRFYEKECLAMFAGSCCWDVASFLSASLTARMWYIIVPTASKRWRVSPDSSNCSIKLHAGYITSPLQGVCTALSTLYYMGDWSL